MGSEEHRKEGSVYNTNRRTCKNDKSALFLNRGIDAPKMNFKNIGPEELKHLSIQRKGK